MCSRDHDSCVDDVAADAVCCVIQGGLFVVWGWLLVARTKELRGSRLQVTARRSACSVCMSGWRLAGVEFLWASLTRHWQGILLLSGWPGQAARKPVMPCQIVEDTQRHQFSRCIEELPGNLTTPRQVDEGSGRHRQFLRSATDEPHCTLTRRNSEPPRCKADIDFSSAPKKSRPCPEPLEEIVEKPTLRSRKLCNHAGETGHDLESPSPKKCLPLEPLLEVASPCRASGYIGTLPRTPPGKGWECDQQHDAPPRAPRRYRLSDAFIRNPHSSGPTLSDESEREGVRLQRQSRQTDSGAGLDDMYSFDAYTVETLSHVSQLSRFLEQLGSKETHSSPKQLRQDDADEKQPEPPPVGEGLVAFHTARLEEVAARLSRRSASSAGSSAAAKVCRLSSAAASSDYGTSAAHT
eukprot:TRINITY_DN31998_c0_g1_i1.p1 TRINITY_DN31998_c0_g1~~TRINITY_DN31998_c0_g1_i1.p1  ORF type:complete len:409 (+),score=54.97 TRINITY_DN31998_c0_g1_i1:72-1298(+)